MAIDYTKMWEAWVSGTGWDSPLTQDTSIGQDRIIDFYNEIVGPSWGGAYTEGEEGFGDIYEQYLGTGTGAGEGWTTKEMERAEREFRMSIGDPYIYGEDPFAWERVSRMTPDQAQIQLEAELYGQGKRLGGESGAAYGTGMSKGLETYTTGLKGESKALTHGVLTSGAALASGTSGATLRSGESITASEDVLVEAYKKAKTLGSEYRSGKEGIESALEVDLNVALTTYINALDDEKSDWYDVIAADVVRSQSLDMGYQFGEVSTEGWGEEYATGLEYEEYRDTGITDDPGTDIDESKEPWFMADEACGIGKVRNADGECVLADELGLTEDQYGYLCPSGNVDECNVCDGNNSTCDDGCGPNAGPKSIQCWDGSMVCSQSECGTEPVDECGVPSGPGPEHSCPDGSIRCSAADCPEQDECGVYGGPGKVPCSTTNQYECPDDCPETMEDPLGEVICDEGYEFDEATGDCVEIYEPPGEYDVLCHEGQPYESWTTGSSPNDYSNCPVYEADLCEDGTERPANGICPEDTEGECPCKHENVWNHKRRTWTTLFFRDCPGLPQDGEPCVGGDGDGQEDYTGYGAN